MECTRLLLVLTENGHILFQLKVKGNPVVVASTAQIGGMFLDFFRNGKAVFFQRFRSAVLFVGNIEVSQKNITHIFFFALFDKMEVSASISFSRLSLSMEDVEP
jgi:hypothetical protein